jgi:hypothetical protein
VLGVIIGPPFPGGGAVGLVGEIDVVLRLGIDALGGFGSVPVYVGLPPLGPGRAEPGKLKKHIGSR